MFSIGMDNSATNAAANNLSAVGGQMGTSILMQSAQ